jgi:hypothetical protein
MSPGPPVPDADMKSEVTLKLEPVELGKVTEVPADILKA